MFFFSIENRKKIPLAKGLHLLSIIYNIILLNIVLCSSKREFNVKALVLIKGSHRRKNILEKLVF